MESKGPRRAASVSIPTITATKAQPSTSVSGIKLRSQSSCDEVARPLDQGDAGHLGSGLSLRRTQAERQSFSCRYSDCSTGRNW
ncbi:unnamed protein product [Arctogadus glacialis]